MDAIFSLIGPGALLAAAMVTLFAGFVKGAVGFAMPLIMISGMSLFVPPTVAVAGIIFPIVVSNLWQTLRGGRAAAWAAVQEHWRYMAIVCVMILIAAQFVLRIPDTVMYLVLGVPVTGLSLIQLFGLRFHVAPGHRRLTEWLVAAAAGTLGGLSGTWGPPTVLYLIALETPKARQLAVQGVVYGLGSLTLLGAHLQSGVLNRDTMPFSLFLLAPALLGMQIGFWTSDRLNAEVFRRVTLIVLVLSGLNLIRRGVMGG